MSNDKKNLLFDETDDRLCLFPVKDDKVWEFYKSSLSLFWTTDEITLNVDYNDWDKMQNWDRTSAGWASDILRGTPSSESSMTQNLGPQSSDLAQGVGALGQYATMGKKFGWWGNDDG